MVNSRSNPISSHPYLLPPSPRCYPPCMDPTCLATYEIDRDRGRRDIASAHPGLLTCSTETVNCGDTTARKRSVGEALSACPQEVDRLVPIATADLPCLEAETEATASNGRPLVVRADVNRTYRQNRASKSRLNKSKALSRIPHKAARICVSPAECKQGEKCNEITETRQGAAIFL